MTVKIKRKRNIFSGKMLNYKLWINGEFSGKIAYGQEQNVSLSEENSVLQIKQLTGKSNELEVNDGDYIEISHTPWLP